MVPRRRHQKTLAPARRRPLVVIRGAAQILWHGRPARALGQDGRATLGCVAQPGDLRQLDMHQLRPSDFRIALGFLLALLGEHVGGGDSGPGE